MRMVRWLYNILGAQDQAKRYAGQNGNDLHGEDNFGGKQSQV